MCGICGIYNFGPPLSPPDTIIRMNNTLAHRGPDGQGFFVNSPVLPLPVPDNELSRIQGRGNIIFGHRRLSIIDIAGGHQPLSNEDGTVWITYNGEIYNFKEIRRELISLGHHFKSNCDTEVIVHAWEEWREQCLKRFRGMFAFALWDSRNDTLFLARDRLGIKPLYYYLDSNRIIFASEIKAILADKSVPRQIDQKAFYDYLRLLYIPAPKSIFKGLRKLPAGHYLIIQHGQALSPRQYWDLSFSHVDTTLSESEWCERILAMLRESIKIRLISDVPLGAFLSGGVDSSAVVALMSSLLDTPVKTSSIGFKDAAFNELQYADQVVRQYQTDHYQKILETDAVAILEQLVWFYDEPFADSSAIPTYLVSKITRKRVTVALSGDGGDENFAGYRRYYFDLLENKLRNIFPDWIRTHLITPLAGIYPKADWLPQIFRAKTLLTNLTMSPIEGYYNSMSWFGPYGNRMLSADVREAVAAYSPEDLFKHFGSKHDSNDPLSKIQYIDIKTYLADDILTKVDRASMANSLEVRVPLLDHKFMELIARIPPDLKLKNREGKYLLKKSLEPLLPDSILYRRKMGFSIPLASWLRKDLKELFEDSVFSAPSGIEAYLDQKVIRKMWQQHQAKTNDYATELWSVLFFAMWSRKILNI